MNWKTTIPGKFQRAASGIVLRLRLVLVGIGIVIALAGSFALWQANVMLAAHQRLNDVALPLLAQTRQSEQDFVTLFVAVDRTSAAQSLATQDRLQLDLMDRIGQMHSQINRLDTIQKDPEISNRMRLHLNAIDLATAKVLSLKRALWKQVDQERAMLQDLRAMHLDSRQLLETLSIRNAAQIDAVLKSVQRKADFPPEISEQLFSDLLFKALNINDISVRLDVIFEQLRTPGELVTGRSHKLLKETLGNKLYDLTTLLSRMPDSPERGHLARHISKVQGLVAAPDGLLGRFDSEQDLTREMAIASTSRADLIARISDTASDLVSHALLEVDDSSAQLRQAVSRLVYVLATAFLLAMAATVATLFWVVERQINRRMHRLNAEVRAIAAGDLNGQITIVGLDELGDMARALKIFKQNALELRRSNVELEQFAYIAAHDLRSPLRAIRDLGQWVQEDIGTSFSPESAAYLKLLLARTERLNQLLNDLLDYSRAGQLQYPPKPLELDNLVRQLVLECDPGRNFAVHCDLPDTPILTYATPLTQIITNLLSNAIKHHDCPQGVIHFSAQLTDNMLEIHVQDDGPGIDPKYHSQIFDLFQTLRPRDEVEGSGLGLAIVAKLTTRFGGSVHLNSDPAIKRGALFTLTFPAQSSTALHLDPNQKTAA